MYDKVARGEPIATPYSWCRRLLAVWERMRTSAQASWWLRLSQQAVHTKRNGGIDSVIQKAVRYRKKHLQCFVVCW